MANLPLVNVAAQINDQQGNPCAGAIVKMKLRGPDKYQGLVIPRETSAVTDAKGHCVLRVFPSVLGYEGCLYDVHISFPAVSGSCGGVCGESMRTIRQQVCVPDSDCNLMDILDLTPRDKMPAGSLLPAEMAGYAAQAADRAASARDYAEMASSSLKQAQGKADAAQAAKSAAQQAADNAEAQYQQAKRLVDGVAGTIRNFETSVTARVENTAATLSAQAASVVKAREQASLEAVEERAGEVLDEIGGIGGETRAAAVQAVADAERDALHSVRDAADNALEELREVGDQYEEDFLALVERADGSTKRAACSAAAAANSATKACECAERAERAEQNIKAALLDAAADIVSEEIIDAAAEKAKQGALESARMVWAPLLAQIIRLTDRHTADTARFERGKTKVAKLRQKLNDVQWMVENMGQPQSQCGCPKLIISGESI